jgi:hypothetical protein
MTFGPVDEPMRLPPSEYGGDGEYGWATSDDLGESKGRVLSGGERAAVLRRDARKALEQAYLLAPDGS